MQTQLYFFYGEEGFLIEEKVHSIVRAYPAHEKESFSDQFKLDDLYQSLSMMSLFSASKILLLKNPFFLFDTLTDAQIQQVFDIFKILSQTPHILIIYTQDKSVDMRKKMNAFLKKNAQSMEFVAFKEWEQSKVMAWAKQRVQIYHKTIEDQALMLLEESNGTNLRVIAQEIDKLCLYIGDRSVVTLNDVKILASGTQVSILDVMDAFKEKNAAKLVSVIQTLLTHGDDPIKLMGLLIANVRFFYQMAYLVQTKVPTSQMAQKTGKNPYYIDKLLPFVRKNYTCERLSAMMALLHEADIRLKTGKMSPQNALLCAVTRFF